MAFVIVVLVVVALAVVLVRRPRGDDVHSVRNYNQALGTLEHLSERIGPPMVRPVARHAPPGASGPSDEHAVPPVPVRGTDQFPDPDAPIVFDEARPLDRSRFGVMVDSTPTPRSDRAQRMALDSMNRRRRSGSWVVVVVVIVALFAGLALLGRHKPHTGAHAASTTGPSTGTDGHRASHRAAKRTRPTSTTRPTPTTLPARFVATTTSPSGTSADYTVPEDSFQITVTGTGACWVEVDSATTGAGVWAGELSAGKVQNVQATGATSVQLGTANATLSVDTVPVVLPTTLHAPFVATFTPSAAAVAAAGPATTTTTSGPGSTSTTGTG
ncbi:MAG: RodZ domain-containing protein [Acidimicrobiales bacterium]